MTAREEIEGIVTNLNGEKATEEQVSRIAELILAENDPRECMLLWSACQKNVALLFQVHPFIEKHVVFTAGGGGFAAKVVKP